MAVKEQVVDTLKKVYDPELHLDIWSLGLVYDIILDGRKVTISMSLTSPVCPYGPALMEDVRRKISALDGVGEVIVDLTFSPPWSPDKMSEEARIALGV